MKKTTKDILRTLLFAVLICVCTSATSVRAEKWKAATPQPASNSEYTVVHVVRETHMNSATGQTVDAALFESGPLKEPLLASRMEPQVEGTPLDLTITSSPDSQPIPDIPSSIPDLQDSTDSTFHAKTSYSLQNYRNCYTQQQCLPQQYCYNNNRRNCRASFWNKVKLYGWVQAGIQANNHGSTNEYVHGSGATSPASRNLEPLSGNSYLLMTQQPTDLHVNQAWFGVTKALDTKNGFDWGFQMDLFWGTDGKYAQCFNDRAFDYDWGTGDYYMAIPQLYAELGYRDLSVKVGKFASPVPHEPLAAPFSFFYSHSYLNYNAPFSHSGAVATYNLNKCWSISGGWVAGQQNSLENKFDDNGFLGNLTFKPNEQTKWTYDLYIARSNGYNKRNDADRYNRFYNKSDDTVMTLRYARQLNRCWFYMIEGIYATSDIDLQGGGSTWCYSYGINQHLIRTINAKWSVGIRAEWLHSKGMIFDAPFGGEGTDLYEITLGANWKPIECFTLRPELRFDWSDYDNGSKPFDGGKESSQITLGCAAIVNF